MCDMMDEYKIQELIDNGFKREEAIKLLKTELLKDFLEEELDYWGEFEE